MVKPGYKQTEIGVIPEDWEVYKLSDISVINPISKQGIPKEFYYIDLESVTQGKLIAKKLIENNTAPSRAQRHFRTGDILYQTVRPYQRNNLFIRFDARKYIASTGYAVIRANSLIAAQLLYQILYSDRFISVVLDNCTGTSYPAVNPKVLSSLEIAIPTEVAEQQRIAETLSDVDELIASLEKLIEKKKAIKQGVMQELLTGKRRLPGYSGEWKSYLYSDICSLLNGRAYSQPELLNEGKYKVLRLGNLFTNEKWYYSDLELPEKQYCDTGDLIFAWSATFGPYIWEKERVIYHYHIWKVICSEIVDKRFLYYYFLYDTQKIKNEVQGGTMAHLTKDAMEKRMCLIPDKTEQEEIGHILTALDEDIQKYELKLEKAQQIKQGMMQQLLTGRIRSI